MSASSRAMPRSLRRYLTSPAAVGYLAVVVWLGTDIALTASSDGSMAGVWLFFLTAPTSFLFVALPGALPWAGVVVGALVQAVALGAAHHGIRAWRARRAVSA
ncbi:SCO4225 family membrane protein [Streptomyces cyaneofuscatus]|uniref:SCO4225 family membrane protein n=1 Tax=Streptomyces cyaneofuscatus TaxID=66883 RepID=UPI0036518A44